MDDEREVDWAGPRLLRMATAIAFVPAFPLCVAHGALSHQVVPAVGLIPLALSASAAIYLGRPQSRNEKLGHPAVIFGADTVLAAALMVTLTFTWVQDGRGS